MLSCGWLCLHVVGEGVDSSAQLLPLFYVFNVAGSWKVTAPKFKGLMAL